MRKFHGEGGEGLKSVCFLYMNETNGEKRNGCSSTSSFMGIKIVEVWELEDQ